MPLQLILKMDLRKPILQFGFGSFAILMLAGAAANAQDQEKSGSENRPTTAADETAGDIPVPERVEIAPSTEGAEIELRLTRILEATGWYRELVVQVTRID